MKLFNRLFKKNPEKLFKQIEGTLSDHNIKVRRICDFHTGKLTGWWLYAPSILRKPTSKQFVQSCIDRYKLPFKIEDSTVFWHEFKLVLIP